MNSISPVVPERRKHQRSYSDLSASLRVLGSDSQLQARILDLTSAGLALMSPERLEPGATVSVTYKGVIILAEVIYCTSSMESYRVGVKVDQALATGDTTVREVETEFRSIQVGIEAPAILHARAVRA